MVAVPIFAVIPAYIPITLRTYELLVIRKETELIRNVANQPTVTIATVTKIDLNAFLMFASENVAKLQGVLSNAHVCKLTA